MKLYFFAIVVGLSALYLMAYGQEMIRGQVQTSRFQQIPDMESRLLESQHKMKNAYVMLEDLLSLHRKEKLRQSQKAWERYSKADCEFFAEEGRQENLQSARFQQCRITMNETRLRELNGHIRRNTPWDPTLAKGKQNAVDP